MIKQILKTDWKKLSRKNRGLLIAKSLQIKKVPQGWRVPSQSIKGGSYVVRFNGHKPECNCQDCEVNKKKCKHIHAVEFYIKKHINREGNITETRGMRVTYKQKWRAYDKSQTNEKLFFMDLLSDLCNSIKPQEYTFGRPKTPIQDLIFSSVMKVYSTFSLRRFMSDMEIARDKGLIFHKPCFASVGHFMQKPELTPILKELIKTSSKPLKTVEKDFAIDSSGFSTSRFARWFNAKYMKESKKRIWVTCHLVAGAKTNIVSACEVTEKYLGDAKRFPELIRATNENFDIRQISADKAYSSRDNFNVAQEIGAEPFIPFKKNAIARSRGSMLWSKMYYYFLYKNDEFLQAYHKRSNVETVFHMIKTKFKDNLRSKSKTAQINEVLCKVICHNICVIIQEMNELGIRGEFVVEETFKKVKND